MPVFGGESQRQRMTLHPDLRRIYDTAIEFIDFSIREGLRGKAAQDAAFANQTSKTPWPKSKHNRFPSEAGDILPYPVPDDWKTNEWFVRRQFFLAGYIKATADQMGIPIRQGVDWDESGKFSGKNSWDAPHSELKDPTP